MAFRPSRYIALAAVLLIVLALPVWLDVELQPAVLPEGRLYSVELGLASEVLVPVPAPELTVWVSSPGSIYARESSYSLAAGDLLSSVTVTFYLPNNSTGFAFVIAEAEVYDPAGNLISSGLSTTLVVADTLGSVTVGLSPQVPATEAQAAVVYISCIGTGC